MKQPVYSLQKSLRTGLHWVSTRALEEYLRTVSALARFATFSPTRQREMKGTTLVSSSMELTGSSTQVALDPHIIHLMHSPIGNLRLLNNFTGSALIAVCFLRNGTKDTSDCKSMSRKQVHKLITYIKFHLYLILYNLITYESLMHNT
jgi:hypothetical protein